MANKSASIDELIRICPSLVKELKLNHRDVKLELIEGQPLHPITVCNHFDEKGNIKCKLRVLSEGKEIGELTYWYEPIDGEIMKVEYNGKNIKPYN